MTEPTDAQPYIEALRQELIYLWGDLAAAYRQSRADPPWTSTGCEHLIGRIRAVTELVGPVSLDQVEMPFLLTGMYELVHESLDIRAQVPAAMLREAREYVATSGG